MHRPDLVRSWVSDALGLFRPSYQWHPLAVTWQTPGEGERWVHELIEAPFQKRLETICALGIPRPIADRLAAAIDAEIGQAILALYRSASQPVMAEAGRGVEAAAARPGLAIVATDDVATDDVATDDVATGTHAMRRAVAARAGAAVAVLDGAGHWWMTDSPSQTAQTLTGFWSALP